MEIGQSTSIERFISEFLIVLKLFKKGREKLLFDRLALYVDLREAESTVLNEHRGRYTCAKMV